MFKKISQWFTDTASWTTALTSLIIWQTFAALVMGSLNNQLMGLSGGTGVLDLFFTGYTVEEAYTALTSYTAAGRTLYQHAELVDLFYPLTYMVFFALATAWVTKNLWKEGSDMHLLNLVPMFAVVVDWSENICFFAMLSQYPTQLTTVATIACWLTRLKWLCAGVSCIVILLGGFRIAYKRFVIRSLPY